MGKLFIFVGMTAKDTNTEQKILDAAEAVFHVKGFDGARMQEIAEQAGINKGLLHYYFKTKDALFEAIFGLALKQVISRILNILELEVSLEEKISRMVDQYMHQLLINPNLPRFVLNELNKNPDRFVARHLDEKVKAAFVKFSASVKADAKNGLIRSIDARQLFINMLSLLVFPFVGRPMLQTLFVANNREYRALMEERKTHIKEFIKAALRP